MENIVSLTGTGINDDIAIGRALVLRPVACVPEQTHCENVEAEVLRLKNALAACVNDITNEVNAAPNEHKEILKSHLNFLEDPAFNERAFARIRETAKAAHPVILEIMEETYNSFMELDIPYLRERAEDVRDVGGRIIRALTNAEEVDVSCLPQGTILFAPELAPSLTAKLDREKVAGFVTERGGKTSHTAIIAKTIGVAAVVGCADVLKNVSNGDTVIIDGAKGLVLLRPDNQLLSQYRERQAVSRTKKEMLQAFKHKRILHGAEEHVPVLANVGNLKDVKLALDNGADGVGLFRTEFLFMNRPNLPSEDEQFEVYKTAAEMLGAKPLVIRTLDVGGDKCLPGLTLPNEENPFLGLRAIRLCLEKTEIFKTQLRAILRAASYGNLSVMFPMIAALDELYRAKAILLKCVEELHLEGVIHNGGLRVGMMIEIPAAALQASAFAPEIDFFSIGTNDLTQYTLAVDRGNDSVQYLYDYMNPAVLQLVENTIHAAQKAGVECCMCGEMAADEHAIPILAQIGLNSFSVSVGEILSTKYALGTLAGYYAVDSAT